MKKLFLFLLIILSCLSAVMPQGTSSPATAATDDLDYQFWNETQLTFPLLKTEDAAGKTVDKLSFFLNGNLRIGRNFSRFVDERIGFGFDYKLNKYVSLTPSYIYIAQQQPTTRAKQFESRLRFAVNVGKSWKKFSVDDRNLFEYRFRNSRADSLRYRNKLRFLYPIRKGEKEIFAPFAANEIYYDFEARTFSRNEFSIGISRKLNSNVTADFFYLRRTNRNDSPKRLNVFGVNLKIKID